MVHSEQTDYIQANQSRLERIVQGTEAWFAGSLSLQEASIVPARIPPLVIKNPYTFEDILAKQPTMPQTEAMQYAHSSNERLAARVIQAKDMLLAAVTDRYTSSSGSMRQLTLGDMPPRLLPYAQAHWRSDRLDWFASDDDSTGVKIGLMCLELTGVELAGSAKEYRVNCSDPQLTKSLSLRYYNKNLTTVRMVTCPAHDELLGRLADAFDDDSEQLMVWSAGAFDDVDEMDAALARFKSQYGQAAPAETDELLAQVRARGLDANAILEIKEPSWDEPTIAQLDEFITYLAE